MRYLVGFICALALGVMGCSETGGDGGSGGTAGNGGSGGTAGNGGTGGCADLAGEWTLSSFSCDGVAQPVPDIDYTFTANCQVEMILTESATCASTIQAIWMLEAGDTTFDLGAVTCSAECTADECQATADLAQPYASTISRSGDTLTGTALVTAQMVSDEASPCQAGETQVSVLVATRYFIPGTGTLPDCTETPIADLNNTLWFEQGTLTIRTDGCPGAMPNDVLQACALNWAFTQTGNEVNIVVDNEYRLEGRLCDDELYLRGGWWLPVQNEQGACSYDDDSATEVGIQAEGNVLTVSPDGMQMTGTLAVMSSCAADYEVAFAPVPMP